MQRPAGRQTDFHLDVVGRHISIYISTEGRLFVRSTVSDRGGTASREQVGEPSGKDQGKQQDLSFEGHTLSLTRLYGRGAAAARIQVEFSDNFGSCKAVGGNGKTADTGTVRRKSLVIGEEFETMSVSTGAVTCSVKSGNVFG